MGEVLIIGRLRIDGDFCITFVLSLHFYSEDQ
jgi:hypothetical protein